MDRLGGRRLVILLLLLLVLLGQKVNGWKGHGGDGPTLYTAEHTHTHTHSVFHPLACWLRHAL